MEVKKGYLFDKDEEVKKGYMFDKDVEVKKGYMFERCRGKERLTYLLDKGVE